MSLLKRIERAQPGSDTELAPVPGGTPQPTPGAGSPAAPSEVPIDHDVFFGPDRSSLDDKHRQHRQEKRMRR